MLNLASFFFFTRQHGQVTLGYSLIFHRVRRNLNYEGEKIHEWFKDIQRTLQSDVLIIIDKFAIEKCCVCIICRRWCCQEKSQAPPQFTGEVLGFNLIN